MKNSAPTIIRTTTFVEEQEIIRSNEKELEYVMANVFPDLLVIWENIKLYQINPQIIPHVLRGIGDIIHGSTCGQVVINIEPDSKGNPIITDVLSIDKTKIELNAKTPIDKF
jgi:hypothetical protein